MFNGVQFIEYSGACDICRMRLSTMVATGASLTDAAQAAVLDHVKLVHLSALEYLPVARIGQLVASSATSFNVVALAAPALRLA